MISVVATQLGSGPLGSYVLFMAVFGLISLVTDLILRDSLMKRISENRNSISSGVYFSTPVSMKMIITLIFGVILLLISKYISSYLGFSGAPFLFLILFIDGVYSSVIYTLQGEDRVATATNLEIVQKLLSRCARIALVFGDFGIIGLIAGLLFGRFSSSVLGIFMINIDLRLPTYDALVSLWNFSKYSAISSMGGKVFTWADTLIIGFILSQSAVGLYEIVWRIAGLMMLFTQSVSTSIFPKVSLLIQKTVLLKYLN